MEEGLGAMTMPCRLLWGEADNVFPPDNARRFERSLPNCSAPRLIPHGKHFIQEDAPSEIAEEIYALKDSIANGERS